MADLRRGHELALPIGLELVGVEPLVQRRYRAPRFHTTPGVTREVVEPDIVDVAPVVRIDIAVAALHRQERAPGDGDQAIRGVYSRPVASP